MRNFLSDYFFYNRNERNGVLFVSLLSLLIMSAPLLYPYILKSSKPTQSFKPYIQQLDPIDTTNLASESNTSTPIDPIVQTFPFNPNTTTQEEFESLGLSPKTAVHYRQKGGKFFKPEDFKKIYGLNENDYTRLLPYIELEQPRSRQSFTQSTTTQTPSEIKPFNFNPNTATDRDFIKLGLMPKTIKILKNYRNKGGKFYKKEDLKKIYTITEADYQRLESFIQLSNKALATTDPIPSQNTTSQSKSLSTSSPTPPTQIQPPTPTQTPQPYITKAPTDFIVDINKAPLEDFLRLHGIGVGIGRSIITLREKFGGFATPDQLKEIRYFPDSTYQKIKPQLRITSPIYRKINPNSPNFNLIKHPYLTPKQIEAIIRYKINHGNYQTPEDLTKVGIFEPQEIQRLKPYLEFTF
jgi:DNA uptake protein ComE-like DNA-binding protein